MILCRDDRVVGHDQPPGSGFARVVQPDPKSRTSSLMNGVGPGPDLAALIEEVRRRMHDKHRLTVEEISRRGLDDVAWELMWFRQKFEDTYVIDKAQREMIVQGVEQALRSEES